MKEGGNQEQRASASDINNFAKPIIDAVTQSRCLWFDDSQIDELCLKRVFVRERQDTDVILAITLLEQSVA